MRISDQNPQQVASTATDRNSRADQAATEAQKAAEARKAAEAAQAGSAKAAKAGAAGAAPTDRVQLSVLADNLRLDLDNPAERAGRIHELTLQVRSGRYRVDAREVARRLVDDAIRS